MPLWQNNILKNEVNMGIGIIIGVVIALFALKYFLTHNISIKDARDKLKAGADLIDVRTPEEFNAGHHSGALNIPVDEIEKIKDSRSEERRVGKECRSRWSPYH